MTDGAPIFVVGLPRSGSTLLSRLLNGSPEILCVNDLYYVQAVVALKALDGELGPDQRTRLVDHLLTVVAQRTSGADEFVGQFTLPQPTLDAIREEVSSLAGEPVTWSALMDHVLGRVTRAAGKRVWADKTPQNFFHIETLRRAFPGARFVFVLRDPRGVLASYKFASGEGHDPRRYHPVPYALYWRQAARRYLALREDEDVGLVLYESLIRSPEDVLGELSRFLRAELPTPALSELGDNSSFRGREREQLRPTEAWLCERICRKEMTRLNYAPGGSTPSVADLPEIALLGFRFAGFQLSRMLRDADARKRIGTFLQKAG